MPKKRNRNDINNRTNEIKVPKPAKGTPCVNQIIAKGTIDRNEIEDRNTPNRVINFSGL